MTKGGCSKGPQTVSLWPESGGRTLHRAFVLCKVRNRTVLSPGEERRNIPIPIMLGGTLMDDESRCLGRRFYRLRGDLFRTSRENADW